MNNTFLEVSENHTASLLYNENNLTVSNTLLHYACLEYMKTYKTNYIPFNYIEYYLKRFNTYSKFFDEDLKYFYDFAQLDKIDISILASVYSKSLTSIVVTIINQNSMEFVVTDEDPVDLLNFYMETNTEKADPIQYNIYNNVQQIIKMMESNDELMNEKELFERYMIQKFLSSYNPTNVKKQTNIFKVEQPPEKPAEEIAKTQIVKLDEDMKGKEVEVPKQSGKVTKLFIPKLMLPSQYPITQETSRINSDYRARSFASPSETINLFGKYKFKQVIYSTGFVEKRKKVKKSKPKFSFDF